VQIGIRFMFTLMAVTYIALAAAVARTWSLRTQDSGLRTENPDGGTLSTRHSVLSSRYIPRWFVGILLAVVGGTSAWGCPAGAGTAGGWGRAGGANTTRSGGGGEQATGPGSASTQEGGGGRRKGRGGTRNHSGDDRRAIWSSAPAPPTLSPPFKPVHLFTLE